MCDISPAGKTEAVLGSKPGETETEKPAVSERPNIFRSAMIKKVPSVFRSVMVERKPRAAASKKSYNSSCLVNNKDLVTLLALL